MALPKLATDEPVITFFFLHFYQIPGYFQMYLLYHAFTAAVVEKTICHHRSVTGRAQEGFSRLYKQTNLSLSFQC